MDRFKRIARRRYPLEYLEILLGRVSEGAIEILKSVPIPHTSTVDLADAKDISSCFQDAGINFSCDFKDADLEVIKLKAEKEGLVFVGTIHSHPNKETTVPSEGDNESALDNQEQVFGIYSYKKNGKTGRTDSKLCFYLPQTAVPIQKP
jgi:proteasome lid subunit RPN8/RPN11